MKKMKLTIIVYEFSGARSFLQAAYEDLRRQNENVSYRYLQLKAGYSTQSNHFWQVLTGRSTLSPAATRRYGRAIGLKQKEIQFLELLAQLDRSSLDEDRNELLLRMKAFPGFKRHKPNGHIGYEFYTDWRLPALRALVTLENFREDMDWIAAGLRPRISRKQAEDGIVRLLELGYLRRDDEGRLLQADPMIGSAADRKDESRVARLAVRNYHRSMLDLARASVEGHAQRDRFIIGNTMAVSRGQVAAIREKMTEFMGEMEDIIAREEPIEVVYRLNMNLFPLLDMKKIRAERQAKSVTKKKTAGMKKVSGKKKA